MFQENRVVPYRGQFSSIDPVTNKVKLEFDAIFRDRVSMISLFTDIVCEMIYLQINNCIPHRPTNIHGVGISHSFTAPTMSSDILLFSLKVANVSSKNAKL